VVLKYLPLEDHDSLCCAKMKQLANEDALTGLALRGVFADALDREVARSRRHGHPLSLVLVDIDNFKQVNDQFGHLAGDAVLCQLSSCIGRLVRREQLLARVGGDELALLLPDVPMEGAHAFADKIRRVIESHPFRTDTCIVRVSVSIGVATLRAADPHPNALIARADAALYEAKSRGRNQVFPCQHTGAPEGDSEAIVQARTIRRRGGDGSRRAS
jgi:diguanylate cyclase (GGDEF)-like protein